MQKIFLSKPGSLNSYNINASSKYQYVLDFEPSSCTVTNTESDLILSFGNGAIITLQSFYKVHEDLSNVQFQVPNASLNGVDFISAATAPSPSASEAVSIPKHKLSGGRFHIYEDPFYDVGGIDYLGGLNLTVPSKEAAPISERIENLRLTMNAQESVQDTNSLPRISVDEEAHGQYGAHITGSLDYDFNKDGEGSLYVSLNNGETVHGIKMPNGTYVFTLDHGTLTLDATTGDFTYTGVPLSGSGADYLFTFTIVDRDGDTAATSTIATIRPTKVTTYGLLSGPDSARDSDVFDGTVREVALTDLPDGAHLAPGTYQGLYGVLTAQENQLTYQQTKVYPHSSQGRDTALSADHFTIPLLLDDGTSVGIPVTISIVDSIPHLLYSPQNEANYGEMITGTLDVDFGADGPKEMTVSINESAPLTGQYQSPHLYTFSDGASTLSLNTATGTFSYDGLPGSGQGTVYTFQFIAQDQDLDLAKATLSFLIPKTEITAKGTVSGANASLDAEVASLKTHAVLIADLPKESSVLAGTYEGRFGTITVSEEGSVTYQQLKVFTHSQSGQDLKEAAETFHLPLRLGDGSSATLPVIVDILDDVPALNVEQEAEGSYGAVLTGTLALAEGADGLQSLALAFDNQDFSVGTLTREGTYTFAIPNGTLILDPKTGIFTADCLPASGSGKSYSLTFALTDGDGDTSTITTTATVAPTNVQAKGTLAGEDAAQDHTAGSGVRYPVTVTDLPSQSSLTPGTYKATYGDLEVTSEGQAFYIQKRVYPHSIQGQDTEQAAETFAIDLVLGDGSTVSIPVTVAIVDDVPTLSLQTQAQGTYGGLIHGTIALDFGADGAKDLTCALNHGSPVSASQTTQELCIFSFNTGTLTLNTKTGAFTFDGLPLSGSGTTYSFTFEATDADNDKVALTTYAAISATPVTTKGTVSQANASHDADVLTHTTHDVAFSALPQGASLIAGTYQGTYGTVTVDALGKAVYAQTNVYTHSSQGADTQQNADQLTIPLRLADNSTVQIPVAVDIVDALPALTVVTEASGTYESQTISGKINFDFGADGAKNLAVSLNDGDAVLGTKNVDGSYTFALSGKTLSLASDGTFAYTELPLYGDAAQYQFAFTATDADNDTVRCTTTANLSARAFGITGTVSSSDADVLNGTTQDVQLTKTLPDGSNLVAGTYTGAYGNITIDTSGHATYHQHKAYLHDDGTDTKQWAETIAIQVQLSDSNIIDIPVVIDITDTVPNISISSAAAQSADSTITGKINLDFSADKEGSLILTFGCTEYTGVKSGDSYSFAIDTSATLTVEPSGTSNIYNFTYTPTGTSPLSSGTYTFLFTAKDADGDTAQATTSVIIEENTSSNVLVIDIEVNESGGTQSYDINNNTLKELYLNINDETNDNTISFVIDNNFTQYTLKKAYNHNGTEVATMIHTINLDEYYDYDSIKFVITIIDDKPAIEVSSHPSVNCSTSTTDYNYNIELFSKIDYGFDDIASANNVVLTVDGTEYTAIYYNDDPSSKYKLLFGSDFFLDGNILRTNLDSFANGSHSISLTITDTDGSVASKSFGLTITQNGSQYTASISNIVGTGSSSIDDVDYVSPYDIPSYGLNSSNIFQTNSLFHASTIPDTSQEYTSQTADTQGMTHTGTTGSDEDPYAVSDTNTLYSFSDSDSFPLTTSPQISGNRTTFLFNAHSKDLPLEQEIAADPSSTTHQTLSSHSTTQLLSTSEEASDTFLVTETTVFERDGAALTDALFTNEETTPRTADYESLLRPSSIEILFEPREESHLLFEDNVLTNSDEPEISLTSSELQALQEQFLPSANAKDTQEFSSARDPSLAETNSYETLVLDNNFEPSSMSLTEAGEEAKNQFLLKAAMS